MRRPTSVLIERKVFDAARRKTIQRQRRASDILRKPLKEGTTARDKQNLPATTVHSEQKWRDQPPSPASSRQPETNLGRIYTRRILEERLGELRKRLPSNGERPAAPPNKEPRKVHRQTETLSSRDQSSPSRSLDIRDTRDTRDQRAYEKIDTLSRLPEQEKTTARKPVERAIARTEETTPRISENRKNVGTDDLSRTPGQVNTSENLAQNLRSYNEHEKNSNEHIKSSENALLKDFYANSEGFTRKVDAKQTGSDQDHLRKMYEMQTKRSNSIMNYEKYVVRLQKILDEYKEKSSKLPKKSDNDTQKVKKPFDESRNTNKAMEMNQGYGYTKTREEINLLLNTIEKLEARTPENDESRNASQAMKMNQEYAKPQEEIRRLLNEIEARTLKNQENLRSNKRKSENNKKRKK